MNQMAAELMLTQWKNRWHPLPTPVPSTTSTPHPPSHFTRTTIMERDACKPRTLSLTPPPVKSADRCNTASGTAASLDAVADGRSTDGAAVPGRATPSVPVYCCARCSTSWGTGWPCSMAAMRSTLGVAVLGRARPSSPVRDCHGHAWAGECRRVCGQECVFVGTTFMPGACGASVCRWAGGRGSGRRVAAHDRQNRHPAKKMFVWQQRVSKAELSLTCILSSHQ